MSLPAAHTPAASTSDVPDHDAPRGADPARRNSTRAARLAAALGLGPLALYAVAHLVEVWASLGGRAAWNARVEVTASRPWLVAKLVVVLAPLVAHAALALRRGVATLAPSRGASAAAGYASVGVRRLQLVTGVALGAWLITHFAALTARLWSDPDTAWLYEALRVDAGRPVSIVLSSVGVAAVAVHVALGVPAAAHTLGLVRDARALGRLRLGAGALGLLLWAGYVNVWMLFATGVAPVFDRRAPLGGPLPAASGPAGSDTAASEPAAPSQAPATPRRP